VTERELGVLVRLAVDATTSERHVDEGIREDPSGDIYISSIDSILDCRSVETKQSIREVTTSYAPYTIHLAPDGSGISYEPNVSAYEGETARR